MDARAGTSVLAALTALALLAAAPAGAGHVAVLVTPAFDPADFDGRGAVGLLVPGVGPTTSGREALDLLGLKDLPAPGCAERRPCPVEILVALPSGDDRPNDRRYPIAMAGGDYRGLLTST